MQPTERGREVVRVAQALVPEIESWIGAIVGADRARALREDLETIRRAVVLT
ncbi:hypothetical protein ACIA5D_42505 [Actinoplanes sp. NPDC051513]|uniref:hypothetical protein n=1 Tax=Actinoplanes sp. NPDC051513 TaxID=3363908 RepID=UPI0037AB902C